MVEAPPLELDEGFVVATGFECSAPVVAGARMDELVKTGHWQRYAEDFQLAHSLGIRYARLAVPFHVVAVTDNPSDFDWRWTDNALSAARDAGIVPMLDLFHSGMPDDIRAVGDRRLVRRFEVYARAVAERYPWVRYYTPVNEPLVLAVFSGAMGLWNERKRDERSFVAALDAAVSCAVRGMEVIREIRPDAIFIQSDACEGYLAADPSLEGHAAFLNERRFVGFDLTYGKRPGRSVADWLVAHGMGEDRLAWFAEHGSVEGCICGHDYYRGNEWLVVGPRQVRRAGALRRGYRALAGDYHARYQMPFMLTETNIGGRYRPRWLAEMWNDTLALRAAGAPVRGFTWYGFVDHVDWDLALTRDAGRVNRCGLVSLDRQPYPIGLTYGQLAQAALEGRFEQVVIGPQPKGLAPAA